MSNSATKRLPDASHRLIVGIDIAKRVHQLHCVDEDTAELFRLQLKPEELKTLFEGRPPCRIAMESCGGAQHWGRLFKSMGHDVELLHPKAVKPYVQGSKCDAHDASGIFDAMHVASVPRVPIKSIDIQNMNTMLTIRTACQKERVAHINRIQGIYLEYGIILPKGSRFLKEVALNADAFEQACAMNILVIDQMRAELDAIKALDERLKKIETALDTMLAETKNGPIFKTAPGIGTVTSAALCIALCDPGLYKNARAFAASVGLVPGFTGSGGKIIMLGITKRGNRDLRRLLVQAAVTIMNRSKNLKPTYVERLEKNKPRLVAAVAIAAHMARSLWAMAKNNKPFDARSEVKVAKKMSCSN